MGRLARSSGEVISVWVDDTGVWGGDLIAVESASSGNQANIWRINSKGQPSFITQLTGGFDPDSGGAITTVPNNVEKYGPWAGKIPSIPISITIFAVDTNGSWAVYDWASLGSGGAIEDIRIIPENEGICMVLDTVFPQPILNIFFGGHPRRNFKGWLGIS